MVGPELRPARAPVVERAGGWRALLGKGGGGADTSGYRERVEVGTRTHTQEGG